MTTFQPFRIRNRDQQDGFERHVWGELEYVDGAGAIMKVRGTGTEDEEAPVLNIGYGFNLPKDSNAEVMLVSLGSDTDQKFAIPTIPHDKQRQWAEGTGGIQSPTDPERAVEIGADGTWLKDGKFFLGDTKQVTLTVSGGTVTMDIAGDLNITSTTLKHGGVNIGKDHAHSGVTLGAAVSGPPEPA